MLVPLTPLYTLASSPPAALFIAVECSAFAAGEVKLLLTIAAMFMTLKGG